MQNYWTNPPNVYNTAVPSATQYQQRPIIDWVVGKASADAYPMAPNGKVMLMDTQEPVVYVKTTDSLGRPSIVVFDLVERANLEVNVEGVVDYDRIQKMIADDRYPSYGRAYYDMGYSGHSTKDRMIARLEDMMGEVNNDYERNMIRETISRIQSGN